MEQDCRASSNVTSEVPSALQSFRARTWPIPGNAALCAIALASSLVGGRTSAKLADLHLESVFGVVSPVTLDLADVTRQRRSPKRLCGGYEACAGAFSAATAKDDYATHVQDFLDDDQPGHRGTMPVSIMCRSMCSYQRIRVRSSRSSASAATSRCCRFRISRCALSRAMSSTCMLYSC